jgi:hypothetical protein
MLLQLSYPPTHPAYAGHVGLTHSGGDAVTEYSTTLVRNRAEIAELEGRARQLREQFDPGKLETAQREADELDGEARSLRRFLADVLRCTDLDREIEDWDDAEDSEESLTDNEEHLADYP